MDRWLLLIFDVDNTNAQVSPVEFFRENNVTKNTCEPLHKGAKKLEN